MTNINNLVQHILSHSGSEEDLKKLKAFLSKESKLLKESTQVLDDILNHLDPEQNSLGYLYILECMCSGNKNDLQRFISRCRVFLNQCSSVQIRMEPQKFAKVCRSFATALTEAHQGMAAIRPLFNGVYKFRENSSVLTPVHTDILQICLISKTYSLAVKLLSDQILDINPNTTAETPKDMLLYFYYGGLVYIGAKKFKEATEFFKICYTTPAGVLSNIVIEAYKKYILCCLVAYGQVPSMPKYTPNVVHRHMKTVIPLYIEFSTAYGTRSVDDLHKCADTNAEVFIEDGNMGIIKQCIKSLYLNNIKRHTQTYMTLSLKDIAESVNLDIQKTESYIVRMIENGEIFAAINQKDGMVAFQEDPEKFNSTPMSKTLDQHIKSIAKLDNKLLEADHSIALSQSFIQKTNKGSSGGDGRWMNDYGNDEFMELQGQFS